MSFEYRLSQILPCSCADDVAPPDCPYHNYYDDIAALFHEYKNPPVENCESLLAEICFLMRVSVQDVKGPSRKREHLYPRHIFCYLATHRLGVTAREIGECINRDRSTVCNSLGVVMVAKSVRGSVLREECRRIEELLDLREVA